MGSLPTAKTTLKIRIGIEPLVAAVGGVVILAGAIAPIVDLAQIRNEGAKDTLGRQSSEQTEVSEFARQSKA